VTTSMETRIDRRWRMELAELAELAGASGGRLSFDETADGLRLRLRCRSPIRRGEAEPVVEMVDHVLDVMRSPEWPAAPLLVLHRSPRGVVHPNLLEVTADTPDWLVRVGRGYVCYCQRPSPTLRLVDIVRQLYDMLGFRYARYTLSDPLSPYAVRWTRRVLETRPGLLPTETEPLTPSPDGDRSCG